MEQEEKEISLTEVFLIFWKKRVLITVLSFLGLILGGLFSIGQSVFNTQVTTIVEYQWEGITRGEYPNGEPFDINNAISATTYTDMIVSLDLNVTSPEIRNELTISPILPNDILAAIQLALEEGENYVYYPTAFRYTLALAPLNISEEKGKRLLNGLIEGFLNEFEEKFIFQNIVFTYAFDSLVSYDYMDQISILKSQISLINTSINRLLPQANNFLSPTLGIGFNDILNQTTLINSIDINILESIIQTNYLSKNVDLIINRLQYENTLFNLELSKQEQIRTDLLQLIESYPGSTTTIIIPGLDGSIQTDSYLETLYDNLIIVNQRIAELEQDIIFNENQIGFYQESTNNSELIVQVESEVNSLYLSLTQLITSTNTLFEEYNRLLIKNIALVLVPATNNGIENIVLPLSIGLFLGGTLGSSITFIQYLKFNYKKQIKAQKNI